MNSRTSLTEHYTNFNSYTVAYSPHTTETSQSITSQKSKRATYCPRCLPILCWCAVKKLLTHSAS